MTAVDRPSTEIKIYVDGSDVFSKENVGLMGLLGPCIMLPTKQRIVIPTFRYTGLCGDTPSGG